MSVSKMAASVESLPVKTLTFGNMAISDHPLESFSVTKPSQAAWESFVGLQDVRKSILSHLVANGDPRLPYDKKLHEESDRILLFGEHGTGKTHLVEAVANCLNATLIQVECFYLIDKWAFDVELFKKAVFEHCKQKDALTILHLKLVGRADHASDTADFMKKLQWEWNDATGDNGNGLRPKTRLAIIATTTQPEWMDAKLVESFKRRIYVPTLNFQERKQLLEMKIEEMWPLGHTLSPKELNLVAKRTYSILTPELVDVVTKALMLQVPGIRPEDNSNCGSYDEMMEMMQNRRAVSRPIEMKDFDHVLKKPFGDILDNRRFMFEAFQNAYGNGPFMKIFEREDCNEDGSINRKKGKGCFLWTLISWIF